MGHFTVDIVLAGRLGPEAASRNRYKHSLTATLALPRNLQSPLTFVVTIRYDAAFNDNDRTALQPICTLTPSVFVSTCLLEYQEHP